MVRKLRGKQLTIPNATERSIVDLYHRHSIEEIEAMTGMRRADIQQAIVNGIRSGKVKAYAPADG